MKTLKMCRCAFRILLYALLTVMIVFIAWVLLLRMKLYCVQTGSMEPSCPVGSMVVVQPVAFDDLHEQDIITFVRPDDTVVTHRIISIDREQQRLTTKGDNNNTADNSPVFYENVIGRVRLRVPYIGYVLLVLNTRFGKMMLAILAFALAGVIIIRKIYCSACKADNSAACADADSADAEGQGKSLAASDTDRAPEVQTGSTPSPQTTNAKRNR